MSISESGLRPASGDQEHGVLWLFRLSRSLKNTELPSRLTWERMSALGAISRIEPVSISDLSVVEKVSSPTMSRTVAALQQSELVRCTGDREDARSVLVTTTAKGRAVLERGMTRSFLEALELLSRLEPEALDAVAELIRRARHRGQPLTSVPIVSDVR